jgi:hypothetical protein
MKNSEIRMLTNQVNRLTNALKDSSRTCNYDPDIDDYNEFIEDVRSLPVEMKQGLIDEIRLAKPGIGSDIIFRAKNLPNTIARFKSDIERYDRKIEMRRRQLAEMESEYQKVKPTLDKLLPAVERAVYNYSWKYKRRTKPIEVLSDADFDFD